MRKLVAAWAFVPALVIVTVFVAAQERPPSVAESLPSGITALAPSPPTGATTGRRVCCARDRALRNETELRPLSWADRTWRAEQSPDLTRSALAMQPDGGQRLSAFLRVGRPDKGMPPVPAPLTEQEAADLSAKLRSLGFAAAPAAATGRGAGGRGGPPLPAALAGQQLSILVGDPKLGKRFFEGAVGKCSTCHTVKDGENSPAASLAHIATKYPDPKAMQNAMLINRGLNWSPRTNKDVTATITYANGRTVKGYLTSVSDFKVVIRDESGTETELPRKDGEPKVVLADRLQHHLDLLATYHDDDIHNLTAYLATFK